MQGPTPFLPLALLLLVVHPGAARSDGVPTVELDAALGAARTEYRPILVFYDGGDDGRRVGPALLDAWAEAGSSRAFQRALARLPVVELDAAALSKPYPGAKPAAERDESVALRLGLVEGVPALVFLDFRERVVLRIVENPPKATKLRRVVTGFVTRNRTLAGVARRTEKILEQARYAFELGKKRTAVQRLVPLEDPKERAKMDPVLRDRVDDEIQIFRARAETLVAKAARLERKLEFAAAIEVLEELTRDYPFPDLVRDANRKKAELLRRAEGVF